MRTSFRQTVIMSTAIIGLSAFAAVAAPPTAGDPTVVRASTANGDQSKSAGRGMEAKVEQRINDLHTKLQISPAQQSQWDNFTRVMRDNAREMDATFQQRLQALPNMTAAENMQSYAKVAAEHSQDMQKLAPAFQSLYDTMSDNQKRTADRVFRADANQRGDQARRG